MTKVELLRVEQDDDVTFGELYVDGTLVCLTLEEPWRNNEPDVSCIPKGTYKLELEYSPSKGKMLWTIKGVPHRTYVRIHSGNTVADTEGCPLTGSKRGMLNGQKAVLASRVAFEKFMKAMSSAVDAEITVTGV